MRTRRNALKSLLAMAGAGVLGGCGFKLRGQSELPFASAYVDAPEKSALAKKLRNYLSGKGKLQSQRAQAQVIVRLNAENRSKTILSLSGAGKVREYRIVHKVTVSAATPTEVELLKPSDLHLARDFSYSDAQALAKEAEEAMLQREMEEELLLQILRRLGLIRLP
jgi:LPS-assembly lipoprotein